MREGRKGEKGEGREKGEGGGREREREGEEVREGRKGIKMDTSLSWYNSPIFETDDTNSVAVWSALVEAPLGVGVSSGTCITVDWTGLGTRR